MVIDCVEEFCDDVPRASRVSLIIEKLEFSVNGGFGAGGVVLVCALCSRSTPHVRICIRELTNDLDGYLHVLECFLHDNGDGSGPLRSI